MSPDEAAGAADLAGRLLARFERTGRPADLEKAVDLARRALEQGAGAGEARVLSVLGSALRARFLLTGAAADLDDAVELEERACELVVDDAVRTARYRGNLALSLRERFLRHRDPADLDAAVRHAEAAVRLGVDADRLERASWSSNLAAVLATRHDATSDTTDLDRAVDAARQAVAATPDGHPDRAGQLTNLGMALIERFDGSGDPDDLREGLDAARQAVLATPDAGPAQAVHLYNLGAALWDHVGVGPGAAPLSNAVDCFRAAARTSTAVPLLRVRAAEGWANLSVRHDDWPQASAGWDQVFDLLPVLVDDALGRPDRQHHLSLLSGAGPDAAAVELALGRTRRAWQRLEQGRGILLGQALQARADEARLAVDHPDLAGQRARLRNVLDLGSAGPPGPERRAGPAEKWTRLLATIRDTPGYERFGALPSAVELSELPVAGPIVALNVSTWRCSALVLRRDGSGRGEVLELPLPDLRYDDAIAHANAFLAAVHTPGRSRHAQLNPVLVWLWDVAVRPVLDHLGHRRPPGTDHPWPRVWWMPTGPLCLLPVHAAGHHDDPDDPRSVVNRVVSSYTPTLRSLHDSGAPGERVGPSVVVGTDGAPHDAALTYAQKEARRVAACIGPSPALLLGPAATRRAVTELLPGASRVHLACHAVAEEDPSGSRLVLADGSMRAGEVSAADLRAGDIVYLSTCTSAYGGTVLPDESLHIASAFQLAGFRHAVATLWPINDVVAPRVAERFYRRLAAGAGPALALHDAVRAVRRGRSPMLWASHVHSGP